MIRKLENSSQHERGKNNEESSQSRERYITEKKQKKIKANLKKFLQYYNQKYKDKNHI